MASVFTRYTAKSVGTSPTTVLTVPASTIYTVIGVNVANTTAANIKVDIYVTISAVDVYLIKGAQIPAGKSFLMAGGDIKHVLLAADALKVVSDTATSADVLVSVLAQT